MPEPPIDPSAATPATNDETAGTSTTAPTEEGGPNATKPTITQQEPGREGSSAPDTAATSAAPNLAVDASQSQAAGAQNPTTGAEVQQPPEEE